jgi:hypothetical protein
LHTSQQVVGTKVHSSELEQVRQSSGAWGPSCRVTHSGPLTPGAGAGAAGGDDTGVSGGDSTTEGGVAPEGGAAAGGVLWQATSKRSATARFMLRMA